MKRNKIILSAVVLLAAVGSAFAIKSTGAYAEKDVFLKDAQGQYIQTDCTTTIRPTNCILTPTPNTVYYRKVGAAYVLLPANYQTYVAVIQ